MLFRLLGGGEVRARSDHGQLLPLYAVIMLVACGAIVLLAQLGQRANRRVQARTAADAAALAGAAEGRSAANAVATANGAVLDDFRQEGTEVSVVVHIAGTHATARAERGAACRQLTEPKPLHSRTCQPTNRG
jgi:uncharacterized membrane protein